MYRSDELSSVRFYHLHRLPFPFQYCFAIMYRRQNQRQYELRAETTSECQGWIEEIKAARWARERELGSKCQRSRRPFIARMVGSTTEMTSVWNMQENWEKYSASHSNFSNHLQMTSSKEARKIPYLRPEDGATSWLLHMQLNNCANHFPCPQNCSKCF